MRCRSRTERSRSRSDLERGLDLARAGDYFAAHEALEDAWRASDPAEKDFFQGLVHVVVAWYQAGRGNRVGCERQLEKAKRRLGPFAPGHQGVDLAAFLRQVETARTRVARGSLDLAPLDVPETGPVEEASDEPAQPPVAVEEEKQSERDEE
jgi:predicted metal-dependent hydrolase